MMKNVASSAVERNQPIVLTCPECSWKINGTDVDLLQREKQSHGMFECPLPVKHQSGRSLEAVAVR